MNHLQRRKCHETPLPCKVCDREAAIAARQARREFELQQKRDAQEAEHERRLKDLEEKIVAEQQIVKDAQLAQERAKVLQQKREDLHQAQNIAASATAAASAFLSSLPSLFSSSRSQSTQVQLPSHNSVNTSPPAGNPHSTTDSGSQGQSTANHNQPSHPNLQTPPQRPQTPPGNPATAKTSSPEAEWQRQKDMEGANNAAIDAVMEMIGLEEVKRQMLRIKDKIEVTQRQSTSLQDERFNVVLLGNPGTGKDR